MAVQQQPNDNKLSIWTVCRFPADFPTKYTARRHIIEVGGSRPSPEYIVGDDLKSIRQQLIHMGLVFLMARDPKDDPVIVESWI